MRTASFVKRLLDLALVMLFIGVITAGLMSVNLKTGTMTMSVPVEFSSDSRVMELQNEVAGPGVVEAASGQVALTIPLASVTGLFLVLFSVLTIAPTLIFIALLRQIFASIVAGDPFVDANIERVRAIGWLTLAFWFLYGALEFGIKTWVMATSTMPGFHLSSSTSWDFNVFVLGTVIVALAEVFRYGLQLQSDANLTV